MTKLLDIDPRLRDLLFGIRTRSESEATASRLIPVVARLRDAGADVPGLQVISRLGEVVTARAPRDEIMAIRQHEQVLSLKACRKYSPTLASSVPAIRAYPEILRHGEHMGVSGRGVIVAVIDWGCDFAHANFRDSRGDTRILAIWDQRGEPSAASPEPYGYGRVMERDEINAALDHDDPYTALGYDPRDADFDGGGTHGTHVLDIAAGSGLAAEASPGVAPGADLMFVHLSGDDTTPQETLGDSARLLEAVEWVFERAGDRPVVINMSLGRTGGPHDGTTLVERALDAVLAEQPGRAIVMSTGNYFSTNMHTHGRLWVGEEADLAFHVPAWRSSLTEVEIWYPGQDELLAEVIAPGGHVVARVALGQQAMVQRRGVDMAAIYHRRHDPNNGDHVINLFLAPQAKSGIWAIRIIAVQVYRGTYHGWIERVGARQQARFLPDVATRSSTTNTVCNGHNTIAVGAYDVHMPRDTMTRFSSSGPTRDGRVKPNITAPGAHILAARSVTLSGRGMDLLVRKSGTSMAAPHVTGVVALMFEAALPGRLSIEQTRAALLATARPIEVMHELDDVRSGAGRANAAAAVAAARDMVPEDTGYSGVAALEWLLGQDKGARPR